ncbi:MAG: NAD(P)H-binding protein [Actinomycetota bacterium]|nr:NAD(P)H-binding protein [Actinomycetota bacterium]
MRIAVVGATGTAGRPLVAQLERGGHEVLPLSRSSATHPIDLLTGAGLDAALEGVEAVIDASNAGPKAADARALLVEGNRRLLAAESRAGVGHHVCLSIVGIDGFPLGYYRVKVEQEEVVRAGDVPWSIVRATQFHSFVAANFAAIARYRLLPKLRAPLQPVDVGEVAELLAEVAAGEPTQSIATIAGPKIRPIAELASVWKSGVDSPAALVPLPALGGALKALTAGALTDPAPDRRGTITFERALASHAR